MATTYINNNVKFHAFSKSPVSPDTTLGGAVNPSGHTITTSQVRAQDIPAFLNTFAGSKQDAITWLGTNYATPAHNDIAYYGGEFKAGFDTPKCLKYNGKTSTWEDFDLKYTDRTNGVLRTTLKNADDKDVLAIHQDCSTVFVDGGNNAATNSNRWSLFVKKSDGSILDHFVASTDKIVAGMPSLGYNALVMLNNAAIDEGELDANYVGNTFAGIIHLNKQYANGDDSKFKVTCFEYIGEKLDESLTSISDSVKDIVNTTMQGVVASVGATTAATAAGISVDSSVTTSPKIDLTTGSVTSGETKLVSGGTVASAIDTAVKITGIQVKVGSGTAQTLTPTNKVVTIEIPEVQAAVVSGGVITTDGFAKASDAKAIAEKAISTSLAGTTDGTIGKAISDVEGIINGVSQTVSGIQTDLASGATAQAIAAAQGDATQALSDAAAAMTEAGKKVASVTGPTTGLVTVTGDKAVTITVSDQIATKTDAATAASTAITTSLNGTTAGTIGKAIADAKSGAEQTAATALSTARGEITTEIGTAVSGLESKLTTGEGSLGAKVAALETATGTTLPAAIEQALTDAKAYSDSLHTTSLDYVVLGDSESLPTASADTLGKIYLVKEGNTANGETNIDAISGSYVEYMTRKIGDGASATYAWEKIGTTAADLTGYAKTVILNGQSKSASANQINLGTVVTGLYNSLASGTTNDSTQPNESSIYAGIHNGGLHIGIASATDTVMGVSKMFTGDLSTAASTVVDTAVSVKSASAMYNTLANDVSQKAAANDVVNYIKLSSTALSSSISSTSVKRGAIALEGGFYNELAGLAVTSPEWGNTIRVETGLISSEKYSSNFRGLHDVKLFEACTKVEGNVASCAATDTQHIMFEITPEKFIDSFHARNAKGLTTWSSDMPNLTNGESMFENCTNLATFCGDLSSMTNGYHMFYLDTALTSFCGDLSSLTSAGGMFTDCKLDAESLEYIADTINDVRSLTSSTQVTKLINIGYNCSAADAQAAYDTITGKGWTCTMTYNA